MSNDDLFGDSKDKSGCGGRGCVWGLVAAVALPVLLIGGCFASLSGGSGNSDFEEDRQQVTNERVAREACQGHVRDELGQVEFRDVFAAESGDQWKVRGTADTVLGSHDFQCVGSTPGGVRLTLLT